MRKEVIAHKNPKSPISEIFRTLRTNIQFMDINKKMRTLLITSTFSGEGKSWTSANLAVTFAQAGKKVILVDADMRKGRQYVIFGTSPKPGLSNYLSQAVIDENGKSTESLEKYIQETEVKNLYMITAGTVPPNPSELLLSVQMMSLIEELKQLCDIVIFDGTPCELVADSMILSRVVDSTIVVAEYKKTKKDVLDRVIKNIQNVGGKLAGVVLNRVPIAGKEYEERYYYGVRKKETKKKILKKMKDFNERVDNNIVDFQKELEDKEDIDIFLEPEETNRENDTKTQIVNSDVKLDEINKEEEIKEQPNISEDENKIEENTKGDNFLDKTNEILKQINEYIDNEKNKSK